MKITTLHDDMIDRLTAKQSAPAPLAESKPNTPERDTTAYCRKALKDECEAMARCPEGQRNAHLNTSSYKMGGLPLTDEEITAGLREAGVRAGLSESEALATIRSGLSKGREAPRPIRDRPSSSAPNTGRVWTWEDLIPADADIPPALPSLADGVLDIPDDWMTASLPPREFVFEIACPVNAVTLLSAQGGAGKSTLILQAGMGLACGRELVPGWKPKEPEKALLVFFEDEGLEVRRRMKRIAFAFELSPADGRLIARNLKVLPLRRPKFFKLDAARNIVPGDHLTMLTEMLAGDEFKLCVLDPLASLLGGVIEESSNEAAQKIIDELTAILPDECALLVASQTSKTERVTAGTPRGAGAWSDDARQFWGMRQMTDAEKKYLPPGTAPEQVVVLDPGKTNYSARSCPVFLSRCGDPRGAGVLRHVDIAHVKNQRTQADAQAFEAALLAVLADPAVDVTRKELTGKGESGKASDNGKEVRALVSDRVDQKLTNKGFAHVVTYLLAEGRLIQQPGERGRRLLRPAAHVGVES